LLAFGRTSVFW